MKLQITGRNLDIGDALRTHITERLEQVAEKYFSSSISGKVTVTKEGQEFRVEGLVHVGTGIDLEARAQSADPYGAADAALTKLEKRLRRYKRRLRDHHQQRKEPAPRFAMAEQIIQASGDEINETNEADEPESLNPIIIAETRSDLQELTVGEAVMQLDISELSFLVFRNGGVGRINVVYRRDDGNIGWIDPEFVDTTP
ncbi:Ribosome hibernation promoting factor Hpf [hydrothermal vent metagenome]|uniref:Ribosome hibernation promoting factor Hpf n=1 Tax=hydrothermal vent metagenome TaxID=652676 RepID=A0A3B0T5N2_9ZZZZ